MNIYPAIDLQDGKCVRLTKGVFETAEEVASDAIETAKKFKEQGAEFLHIVDLDGAKLGSVQNRGLIIDIARESELSVEVGGGIRDIETARYYLEHGIDRVILGSVAVKNPKLLADLVFEFKDRIVVGIDAMDGIVKTEGWLDDGKVNFVVLAKEMFHIGVDTIIYTNIAKDGTLEGPAINDLIKLKENVDIKIIASGGIKDITDIKKLAEIGMYGAICGKSLYQGTLDLSEAVKIGKETKEIPLPKTPKQNNIKKSFQQKPYNKFNKGKR